MMMEPLARDGEAEVGGTGTRKQFLDLPWEDVLFPHILSYLPLRQLLILQRVSKAFQSLIQLYLTNMRYFDSSKIRRKELQNELTKRWLHFGSFMSSLDMEEEEEVANYKTKRPFGEFILKFLLVGPHLPKAAFCILLKDNEVLQRLSLQNCSSWLSDKELLPVIGQNHQLMQIDLNGCIQLSRHALVAISLSCPNLRQLSLAHCEWVDGLSLRSLADHCKELESLDLTACRHLKDEAICYLAQRCHRLKSLSLAVNANIGDVAVEEVAKSCPELEHLDLTGCLRVKNNSIRTVAEYCPKLRALKVKHCHDVVESSLSILRSRGVELDVEPPLQRALVLLQDVVGFAPFINLQI